MPTDFSALTQGKYTLLIDPPGTVTFLFTPPGPVTVTFAGSLPTLATATAKSKMSATTLSVTVGQ